jgi:hypothetical protein
MLVRTLVVEICTIRHDLRYIWKDRRDESCDMDAGLRYRGVPTRSVRRTDWETRRAALLESGSGIDVAPTVTSDFVNARQCSAKRSKQQSEACGRLCAVKNPD